MMEKCLIIIIIINYGLQFVNQTDICTGKLARGWMGGWCHGIYYTVLYNTFFTSYVKSAFQVSCEIGR